MPCRIQKTSVLSTLILTALMLTNSSYTYAADSQANLYETIKGFNAEGTWEGISSSFGKIKVDITFNASDISSGQVFWVSNDCSTESFTPWTIYTVIAKTIQTASGEFTVNASSGISFSSNKEYLAIPLYTVSGTGSCKIEAFGGSGLAMSSGSASIEVINKDPQPIGTQKINIPVRIVAIKNSVPPGNGWGSKIDALPENQNITLIYNTKNTCNIEPQDITFEYFNMNKQTILNAPPLKKQMTVTCAQPVDMYFSYKPTNIIDGNNEDTDVGNGWKARLTIDGATSDNTVNVINAKQKSITLTSQILEQEGHDGEFGEINGSGVLYVDFE